LNLPEWLVWLSVASLAIAALSAVAILSDLVLYKRQMMTIMKWVWPITGLYLGPIAVWAYYALSLSRMGGHQQAARDHAADSHSQPGNHADRQDQHGGERVGHEQGAHRGERQPFWQVTFKGTTHCGAGCTLGDILAEWGVFFVGATIAGLTLWPEYIGDFLLAYILGIVFQYFAIAPMRGLGLRDGIVAAIKADTLALTAFEVGLFGWMAIFQLVIFDQRLHPDNPVYWFMMQIGMVVGFITSYPMNWWLIKQGLKEEM
jgi:hypothetical protein